MTKWRERSPNQKTAFTMVGVVVTMGSLAWAAVPFYTWFCRTTGYAGATVNAAENTSQVLDRTVTIAFDANTDPGMPWEFRPDVQSMKLRIGETALAFYTAHNTSDRVVAGSASFNVAPDSVGAYFTKIDCFCFTQQILQPGETVEMPVTFYVDPEIVNDNDGKHVSYITLSYTFHETPLPESQASLAPTRRIGEKTASE
ncbi:MAG: cytochrome c oxidase assembly protein [Deltaproteobacteria bacterium]